MNAVVLIIIAVMLWVAGFLVSLVPRGMAVFLWIAAVVCLLLALFVHIRDQA